MKLWKSLFKSRPLFGMILFHPINLESQCTRPRNGGGAALYDAGADY